MRCTGFRPVQKKWQSYLYRTATTTYRCCLPALAGFSGSWSYRLCRRKDNHKSPTPKFFPGHSLFARPAVEPGQPDQPIPPPKRRMKIDQYHIVVRSLHMVPLRQGKRRFEIGVIPVYRHVRITVIPHLQEEPALITTMVLVPHHLRRIIERVAREPCKQVHVLVREGISGPSVRN